MPDILNQDITKDLGLDRLSEAERNEALLAIGRVVYEAVLWRVVQLLDDAGRLEFDVALEQAKSDEEILKFLETRVPNLDEIIKEETTRFKSESVQLMRDLV